jgi:hypothetical protein
LDCDTAPENRKRRLTGRGLEEVSERSSAGVFMIDNKGLPRSSRWSSIVTRRMPATKDSLCGNDTSEDVTKLIISPVELLCVTWMS